MWLSACILYQTVQNSTRNKMMCRKWHYLKANMWSNLIYQPYPHKILKCVKNTIGCKKNLHSFNFEDIFTKIELDVPNNMYFNEFMLEFQFLGWEKLVSFFCDSFFHVFSRLVTKTYFMNNIFHHNMLKKIKFLRFSILIFILIDWNRF